MADVTGALHHEFAGKTYVLRLTLGGIAALQGRYGNDLGGLLTVGIQGVPPFGLMIDIVTEALRKGERMPESEARDLADDILTADQSVAMMVLTAAFPDQPGNEPAPKSKGRR